MALSLPLYEKESIMTISRAFSFAGLRRALLLSAVSGLAFVAAAPLAHAYTLDVPYVPTPAQVVNRMLELAQVGPEDFVIDLGSGDGRIAIAAVKDHGAKGALGVDLNPERIAEARANATEAGVTDKVEFREQNLFDTDFSSASVLTMYLLPDVNLALRDKVLALEPGTRVVSHAFDMEDWEADVFERVDGRSVHLWIVPAQVAGHWKLDGPEGGMALELTQVFQNVSGTAQDAGGQSLPVSGSLNGSAIRLVVGDGEAARTYTGNVQGSSMLVAAAGSGDHNWKGTRQ